jgi:riboflavin kinase/FMN adenylyltransferase
VATVGKFSVVHRGHRALFERIRNDAEALDAIPAVVTFDRHPLETLAPDRAPECVLATLDQRLAQLEEVGAELVLVLEFTPDVANWEPEEFVERTLVRTLRTKKVVVGSDHRFGHKHRGDVALLRDLGRTHGFEVEAIELVHTESHAVSSTSIRDLVAQGDVARASELWGRAYRVEGTVVPGARRGKTIGFPTANLEPSNRVCVPAYGVYAGWWLWRGRRLPGVVNYGLRPTFADVLAPKMEIHLFDFDADLYGEKGEIEFTDRLRDERKFASPEELVAQIRNDVQAAKRILGSQDVS